MDHEALSSIVWRSDCPAVVVTVEHGGQRGGCLVTYHGQCSIEPSLYAVWLSKPNHTFRVAADASHLAVHFLGRSSHDLAELFGTKTGDVVDKFASVAWENGPYGIPLLSEAQDAVILRVVDKFDSGGDHVCFVGEPVFARAGADYPFLPMSALKELEPGHPA